MEDSARDSGNFISKNKPFFNSIEGDSIEDDKSSIFTLKSEHHQSIDPSEYPFLSNLINVDSECSKSSIKNASLTDLTDQFFFQKTKKARSVILAKNNLFNEPIHEIDKTEENNLSCASEITELSSSQFETDKDIKSKPCCTCLIL